MLGHRALKAEEYLEMVKRRRWTIAIPAVLLPIIAFAIASVLPPQYVSQTLVLVEQQKVPDDYVKPVVTSDLDQRLASMKEQILSRSRIEPIIQRFNLFPGKTIDDRLDLVRKNISIKPIKSDITQTGGLPGFFIAYKAGEPHTAQQVCGEITSLFVSENLRARQQSAQGTTTFLEGQLAQAKANLDQQDAKLADFQRKFLGRLPGEENTNLNMLNSLNSQLEAATQSLTQLQQQKAYQESMLTQMSREPAPVVTPAGKPVVDERVTQLELLQAQANEMSARYTPDYPDLVSARRKIAELKRDIARSPMVIPVAPTVKQTDSAAVQQLRAQIQATDQGITAKQAEEVRLQSQIGGYQGRISGTPQVEEQYKALTRDYQTAQKFYDDLLAKMNQSKMATDLERRQQGEQFTVMDEPNLPDSPAFPKKSLFLAGGLFLGLLIGTGIAAFLEYRNTAIRTEDDIYAFLKLPTLAHIQQAGSTSDVQEKVVAGVGKLQKPLVARQG